MDYKVVERKTALEDGCYSLARAETVRDGQKALHPTGDWQVVEVLNGATIDESRCYGGMSMEEIDRAILRASK